MPDGERFVPLEQVIAAHLDQLFPGMEVETTVAFRVTRNADLTLEEEGGRRPARGGRDGAAAAPVPPGGAARARRRRAATRCGELLQRELEVSDDDVYLSSAPLDLGGLWSVHALDRPELKDPILTPVTPPEFAPIDDEPRQRLRRAPRGDVLVHHPYDSFTATVEEFIRQASNDPKVLAIKLTLYRTSDDSPIVHSLIRAAERGKQVAVLVELKARGDEQANIDWARSWRRRASTSCTGSSG